MILLLNFSHPLTDAHLAQAEALTGQHVERVAEVHSQIDAQQPLSPQVVEMVDACGLSPAEWQTLPLLVNPPALNFSAVALLAELHGRLGYFPAVVRTRPIEDSLPPRYEVAEIVNLQALRDAARQKRV
jgi:hypothetical protein